MVRFLTVAVTLGSLAGGPALAQGAGGAMPATPSTTPAPANPSAGTVSPGAGIASGSAASPGNTEVAPPTGLSTTRPPGVPAGTPVEAPAPQR